jgi:uncharacterized membrane protein YfcA
MIHSTILTILLGSVSGFFGGALGQSGAETMLPGLLILGLVPNFKVAAGTVLLAIIPPISILAVLEYYRRKEVQIYTALLLFIAYFIAAYFGAFLTKDITNKTLEIISGIYFILIGCFFIWNSITGTYGENNHITHVSHSSGFKNIFRK